MSDLNWNLRDILYEFKDSRLPVFVSIYLHKNLRNRSWPSNELIAKETGLSSAPISNAIDWLTKSQVVMLVPFEKRVGLELKLPNRKNIYQLTGVVLIGEEYYPYMNLAPEGWQSIATDLELMGNSLLSKQLNDSDSLLSKRLDSKHKGIKGNTDSEGSKEKSADAPRHSPSKPSTVKEVPPSGAKKRSEKSPSTREGWLERLTGDTFGVVEAMLKVCYSGWDVTMHTPEHSLTIGQLEKYITNAEEFIRLGGQAGEVEQVYEFIGEVDYNIAPQTIANNYLKWKGSQKAEAVPVEPTKVAPTQTFTPEQWAARAAQMKEDRAKIFGTEGMKS